ncbi:MAG TPA: ABC transporter ATP-binding protein [Mycobacteriales bacterium]|jgi:molybdate transport system ATP-binding protein|nr:ABC transporter ATP-binding protein [Mycobacteriales bacterium]
MTPGYEPAGERLDVRAVLDRRTFRLEVEFGVAAGEILGVLGPNGAGKTTLLRAIGGLIGLTAGRIAVGDEILDEPEAGVFTPIESRRIGFVFQNYRLFPHLSVRDNVAFGPRRTGAGRRGARQRADVWLQRLDLMDFADRKPGQLSGGQAQRVALARALATDPRVLLMDEPLSALDAGTKLEVRGLLRRHLAGFAGPTLIVTHDPLEAMVLTDRLLVLEAGRVVQYGTPAEVARRPATQYVARLVGLNFYAGARDPSGRVLLDGGGALVAAGLAPADGAQGPAEPPTGPVLLAIRPAAIALHTLRPEHASPRNVWPGTVAGMELLTDRIRVAIDATPPALVDVTAAAVAELGLDAGTPVWLSAKATDIDVYAHTGR